MIGIACVKVTLRLLRLHLYFILSLAPFSEKRVVTQPKVQDSIYLYVRVCINVCATKTALFSLSYLGGINLPSALPNVAERVASFVIVGADYRVQSEEKREARTEEELKAKL